MVLPILPNSPNSALNISHSLRELGNPLSVIHSEVLHARVGLKRSWNTNPYGNIYSRAVGPTIQ